MPVKKEMAMGTKHRKGYLRSKTSKFREGDMLSHGETAFPHQGRVLEGCSLKKGHRKVFSAEDEPANRLVKIELDVAEALAEFLRIAHLPHQQNIGGDCDAGLQWSGKRKRTMRPNKDVIDPSGLKKEPEDAHFSVKKNKQRDSDELESTMILPDGGKVSPPYESRSESPSSPLPSLQLACRTLLVGGGPPAKSAFHRVVPLGPVKKPCLLPVKTEIEEVHLESSAARPQKAAVRRKPRARKHTLRVAPVKMETLNEQDIDTKDLKGVGSQDLTVAESAVKSLANIASQLVELSQEVGLAVMSKPKAALTEEEKEARRLHRIQANRESARQTIRRKQILCEELTMKAASLTLENEGMKQKRDLLMQELYSLKGQNYHLKQQLEIGSSGNLGAKSVQLSLRMSSQPVGLPALQVPSLPCAGVPLHSFVWAVAVAQAVTANQPCLLNNNEMIDENFRKFTNDQSVQHQTTACVLSGMPPSNQVSITEVTEQKHSHNSNGVCSPISTNLSKKEMSSTAVACVESCTLQSAGAPCDPDSASIDAQQGLESTNGVDSLRKPAGDVCMLARGSSYQPTAVLPFTSKCGLDDVHGTLMGSESMERYMGPQIAQSVSYGISCNGSSVRVPLKGPLQAGLYSGRKTYAAAMAAAEARRRRKELTRSKFSRSRASRLLHR